MRYFLEAITFLLLDLASTIFFLVLFLLTQNMMLSVGLGIALGASQIAIQLVRRKRVHIMEWLSLILVVAAATATLLTDDLRFMLFKPSVIYLIVGFVMLKAGWINRYMPPIARTVAPDAGVILGFVWAGLMFVSAAVNAFVAIALSVPTWAMIMPVYGIVSKLIVFVGGFLAIRLTVRRRVRALPDVEREALFRSTGHYSQPPSLAEPA
jgi:intracellular septation protein A